MRQALGITGGCKAWTSLGKELCGPSTPQRIQAVLDVAVASKVLSLLPSDPPQTLDQLMTGFYCDVSQGIQLKKWGDVETLNTGRIADIVSYSCSVGCVDWVGTFQSFHTTLSSHVFVALVLVRK